MLAASTSPGSVDGRDRKTRQASSAALTSPRRSQSPHGSSSAWLRSHQRVASDKRSLLGTNTDELPQPTLLQALVSSAVLSSSYLSSLLSRKTQRRGVYIGICTIALVVVITTILECAIAISPVVFLRLSETSTSEEDAILTAQVTLVRALMLLL